MTKTLRSKKPAFANIIAPTKQGNDPRSRDKRPSTPPTVDPSHPAPCLDYNSFRRLTYLKRELSELLRHERMKDFIQKLGGFFVKVYCNPKDHELGEDREVKMISRVSHVANAPIALELRGGAATSIISADFVADGELSVDEYVYYMTHSGITMNAEQLQAQLLLREGIERDMKEIPKFTRKAEYSGEQKTAILR